MSRNYYLCCDEIEEYVWIGQSLPTTTKMDILYYGEPKTMEELKDFLNKTKGKTLIFRNEHEYDDYKELRDNK